MALMRQPRNSTRRTPPADRAAVRAAEPRALRSVGDRHLADRLLKRPTPLIERDSCRAPWRRACARADSCGLIFPLWVGEAPQVRLRDLPRSAPLAPYLVPDKSTVAQQFAHVLGVTPQKARGFLNCKSI